MSHFSVLVIDDDEHFDLDEAMAPYNEQPEDDSPYLEFNDCTEEVVEEWKKVPLSEAYFGDSFDGSGSRVYEYTRHSEADGKTVDRMVFANIDEYADKYHGYTTKITPAGKAYGYMTNPNAKWDWYQVGGRWTGSLKLKEFAVHPDTIELDGFAFDKIKAIIDHLKTGPQVEGNTMADMEAGEKAFDEKLEALFGAATDGLANPRSLTNVVKHWIKKMYPEFQMGDKSWGSSRPALGYADVVRKDGIDIEGMEAPKREHAELVYDEFHLQRDSLGGQSYADLMRAYPEPSAENPFRIFYETLPEEFKKWSSDRLGFFGGYDEKRRLLDMGREEYVACQSIWSPFAVLWNGKWYEQGEMGWFGVSSNNDEQWHGVFKQLWDEIPDTAKLIVVDCHI